MSTFLPATAGCPRCGHRFDVEMPLGLHAERVPALRDDILAGRLQRFTCPRCTHAVRTEPSLLYTDFDRRHWLVAVPHHALAWRGALAAQITGQFDTHMRHNCPAMVAEWADDFTVRLVFGYEGLRDKLVAFDAGLDDRLVEVLKWTLARDTGRVMPDAMIHLVAADDHALHFELFDHRDARDGKRATVPRARLDGIARQRARWAEQLPELFAGPIVEWRAPLWPDEPLPTDAAAPPALTPHH